MESNNLKEFGQNIRAVASCIMKLCVFCRAEAVYEKLALTGGSDHAACLEDLLSMDGTDLYVEFLCVEAL